MGAEREEELPAGEVPQLAPRPQRVSDHVHHDEDRQDGQVSNECLTMFRSSVLYGFLWTFGYYNSTPFPARFMDDLEVFGLLVACLCHDLDHRGTNNSYQTKVGKHEILSGSVNILFIRLVNIDHRLCSGLEDVYFSTFSVKICWNMCKEKSFIGDSFYSDSFLELGSKMCTLDFSCKEQFSEGTALSAR